MLSLDERRGADAAGRGQGAECKRSVLRFDADGAAARRGQALEGRRGGHGECVALGDQIGPGVGGANEIRCVPKPDSAAGEAWGGEGVGARAPPERAADKASVSDATDVVHVAGAERDLFQ
ncbi:hypothetical protein G6F65_021122 [Rhizopus arrhizus]|nr:hypothetical protein G6F65_021122 [Rhizopus arrhizus]